VKPKHLHGALIAFCLMTQLFCVGLSAQVPTHARHVGVPQDWSSHNIIFSRDALAQHPEIADREPRIRHQLRLRASVARTSAAPQASLAIGELSTQPRDWNVSLGRGRVSSSMFPAKFSFDADASPDCTNDYVVFGLSVAGVTGGQANLVAFNNLYSGAGGLCGAAPTVLFAYNVSSVVGGLVRTSPVLSEDGTKIAFVESLGSSAIFHVLTWTAGQGAVLNAAAPTMTSLTFSTTDTSTTTSPWYDFVSDTAYVCDDGGLVYQITGVFNGTPTLSGAPWPVSVGVRPLSPPVLDSGLGLLMVGSRNGNLYQIDITTGAVSTLVVGVHGGTTPGIAGGPIVDVTNGTTFVVSANDGTSGVIVEVDTATLLQLSKARIGIAAQSGTNMFIYQPAFSNSYYNDPSNGNVHLCGTDSATTDPWEYSFGFVGRTMKTTPAGKQQLATSTAARCTGWTEFFNPNIGGGTDFYFFGLTTDCFGVGTSGCVMERVGPTLTSVAISGGPSGIVVDNDSTAGQASSIYLTSERAVAGNFTAYKFTQNGLQ